MIDRIADIQREIGRLSFERPKDLDIKVGCLDKFVGALEERVGGPGDPRKPKGIIEATFCGVKVREDARVPDNMAVIMQGNEIVNIVKFA